VLIKAANWLTHLEYEWESPVWRHWIRFFSDNFHYIRFDERGCGMTDLNIGDLSLERWVEDLEEVVAAANPQEPFTLLGMSQGGPVCVAYAFHASCFTALTHEACFVAATPNRRASIGRLLNWSAWAGAVITPPFARSSRRASSPAERMSNWIGLTNSAGTL
jgi:pimeloyl-ACP methyl ester carboxylesterase